MSALAKPAPAAGLLPGRPEAETALRAATAGGRPFLLAVYWVRDLDLVNHHLGYEAGDEVLAHLSRQLPATNAVFRWSGCALVALFDAEAPPSATVPEVVCHTGRLSLPLGIHTRVLHPQPFVPPFALFRQVDLAAAGV